MIGNTRRNRRVLAGIAGVNLCLAVAVSAGAVPLPGNDDGRSGRNVASATSVEQLVAPVRQAGDVVDVTTTAVPPTVPVTVAPRTDTTVAAKAAPTTAAPAKASTAKAAVTPSPVAQAPVVQAPAVTVPPVVLSVARRVPAASEVQQAITALPTYVRSILAPSPAQVAQLGDKVCTMFDQGQTFAQVKATGLSMVTQVPLTTVLPGGADWVVRTAVTLYCPGHLAKIG